jgi:RNA polymerase sigma-70 factor (family 1)
LQTAALNSKSDPFIGLGQIDEDTFIGIYTQYWPKLYAIAFNRLNSKQSAEDVVQEVMVSLWHRRKEVEIKNLEAWLAAATKYSVFRQLAKYGPQRIAPLALQPDNSYNGDFDFRILDKMLKEHIHNLPPKCKMVFEYSRNHGLSNKQIAGEMSISEKSVEKHITKAIHNLRAKVGRLLPLLLLFLFYILNR